MFLLKLEWFPYFIGLRKDDKKACTASKCLKLICLSVLICICYWSMSLRTATLFCRSLSLSARIFICSALSDLRFSWGGKDKKGSGQSDRAVELSETGEYAWDTEGDMSIQCDLWGSEALLPPSYASQSELLSETGAPSGPFPSVFGECPENIHRQK